jgi:hypothetical protein
VLAVEAFPLWLCPGSSRALPRDAAGRGRPFAENLPQEHNLSRVMAVVRGDGRNHPQTAVFAAGGEDVSAASLAGELLQSALECSHRALPFFGACRGGSARPTCCGVPGDLGIATLEPLERPVLPIVEMAQELKR